MDTYLDSVIKGNNFSIESDEKTARSLRMSASTPAEYLSACHTPNILKSNKYIPINFKNLLVSLRTAYSPKEAYLQKELIPSIFNTKLIYDEKISKNTRLVIGDFHFKIPEIKSILKIAKLNASIHDLYYIFAKSNQQGAEHLLNALTESFGKVLFITYHLENIFSPEDATLISSKNIVDHVSLRPFHCYNPLKLGASFVMDHNYKEKNIQLYAWEGPFVSNAFSKEVAFSFAFKNEPIDIWGETWYPTSKLVFSVDFKHFTVYYGLVHSGSLKSILYYSGFTVDSLTDNKFSRVFHAIKFGLSKFNQEKDKIVSALSDLCQTSLDAEDTTIWGELAADKLPINILKNYKELFEDELFGRREFSPMSNEFVLFMGLLDYIQAEKSFMSRLRANLSVSYWLLNR